MIDPNDGRKYITKSICVNGYFAEQISDRPLEKKLMKVI